MAAPWRADGLLVGLCCVQSVPFHTHVSPLYVLLPVAPPNSTTFPVPMSYTMLASARPEGLCAGDICVHVVPSHTHVSLL
jgi:hypothetical protein